jgi:NRE family putative nickel resistance protein-like MFS transporter
VKLFHSLKNPIFTKLYFAQTTSLLGDALTWVGLALLAFELTGTGASEVLAIALTLRVTVFVIFSPLAGVLADRYDRKPILIVSHLIRMIIVGLLPFVQSVGQIYVLVLALNIVNAFFTPTYKATIPLVTETDYPEAIALSSSTEQLLGVLGPGLAGAIAAFIGARQIFFLDAISFLIAAGWIASLPGQLRSPAVSMRSPWKEIQVGSAWLWSESNIRFALVMQLVGAIAGAQILVNTVGYVKGHLQLGSLEYGWVMMALGFGATIAALTLGKLYGYLSRLNMILMGAIVLTFALMSANSVGIVTLMGLWFMAGMGQTWINVPTQTVIADRTPREFQGRAYGAHFAWSHLWWAIAYPIAGYLGGHFSDRTFLVGGLISAVILVIAYLKITPHLHEHEHEHSDLEHEHLHIHDEHHQHLHPIEMNVSEPHSHIHNHIKLTHIHSHHTHDGHHAHHFK